MLTDAVLSRPELAAVPRRAEHVTQRPVDGELILYDPKRQYVHALNPSAALVWLYCDGKHDRAAIVEKIVERYPSDREVIEQDVPEVLGVFLAEGLLKT